jgi:MFS family permease
LLSFSRYGALFAAREVRQIFLASFVGRLPIGLTGLALLLLVQDANRSFALGGGVTACYIAGLALIAPALGRAIDRRGPLAVLRLCAIAFPAALVALVACVQLRAPLPTLFVFAVLAGAAFPPISVCMRAYFKQRFAEEQKLAIAYSVESVLIEIVFIAGPMLVAVLVAVASAAAAVGASALFGALGTLLFLRSPALRAWRIEPRNAEGLLGALGEPGFIRLLVVILAFCTAFGLMEIGVTAYAIAIGDAPLAGVFLGVMSIGSALGGLAYGARAWRGRLERQFTVMLAAMGAGILLLVFDWPAPAFAACAALAGIVMAPTLIIQSMLVARAVRPQFSTEAFTWSSSALLAGVGLGMAGGGILLETLTYRAALGTAAAAALAASLGAAALLRGGQADRR